MATANLGLSTSTVGSDTGADASTREQTNINLLDLHDHTTGKGVKVPTGGLNINADLTFANNSATNLKSSQFSSQVSNLLVANTLFVKNNELYYVDGSLNVVQLTSGGAVSVSSLVTGSVLLDAGNTRGANLRFGTNDSYSAIIETNNTDRFSINSSGFAQFLFDYGVAKGAANSSTGTLNDVSTSQKSYFSFTGASAVTVTGFANGSDGKLLYILNKTGTQLTINNNDTGSSAANRILTGTGAAISVENNASLILIYDAATSLWNVVGGTGGGSSGLPVYNINLAGGTLYNDSAATPVDGTGGTTTGMTYAAVTSGTLRGAVSYKLSKDAANRQGNGVAFDLTIDTVDKSSVQSIQFDISSSANFVSGDAYLYIYDVTNSTMLPAISVLPTGTQPQFSRAIVLTTGTQYRILLHVASTSALAYDITIDAMTVNSIIRPQVAGISDTSTALTFTPNNWGTITNSNYTSWRVGDRLHARLGFQYGILPATTLSISLPTGLTIDTTKMSSNASGSKVGTWVWFNPGAAATTYANSWAGDLFYDGSTNNQIFVSTQVGSNAYVKATTTGAGNNVFVYLEFSVPITQWSSGITLSSTGTPLQFVSNSSTTDANDTTSFVYGVVGSSLPGTLTATRTKRVQLNTPYQSIDDIDLFILPTTDNTPIKVGNGLIRNNAGTIIASPLTIQNTTTYGIGIQPVSGSKTQIDVVFGQYSYPSGATFASAGTNWTNNGNWFVKDRSSIGAAELAPATISSQGTVAFSQTITASVIAGDFTGLGTPTAISIFMRREADCLVLTGGFTTGTPTAVLGKLLLPAINGTRLTIDTTKVITRTATPHCHVAGRGIKSITANVEFTVLIDSNDNTSLYFSARDAVLNPLVPNNGNAVFNATEICRFDSIRIPIVGWS
jgi:hypothetical protein